jgi:hypothetical protein
VATVTLKISLKIKYGFVQIEERVNPIKIFSRFRVSTTETFLKY